jgi:hypothetical protein
MNMVPGFPSRRRALQDGRSNDESGEIVDAGHAAAPPEDAWCVKPDLSDEKGSRGRLSVGSERGCALLVLLICKSSGRSSRALPQLL